jgi:hypothetical protein
MPPVEIGLPLVNARTLWTIPHPTGEKRKADLERDLKNFVRFWRRNHMQVDDCRPAVLALIDFSLRFFGYLGVLSALKAISPQRRRDTSRSAEI